MSEQSIPPVVVAVGDGPVDGALAFAATQAARAGCGIHLVHVVELYPETPERAAIDEAVTRGGRARLEAAVERTRSLLSADITLTSELAVGAVVPTLVDISRRATMIVLEPRHLSTARRVFTRSTSSGVAAHARSPVVSVPASWTPERRNGGPRKVSVGVDALGRSGPVLATAAEQAKGRGARLHVLHTWSVPTGYEVRSAQRPHLEWVAQATRDAQGAVDLLADGAAGPEVEVEAKYARASDALIEASRDADLLVIGRHDPLVPFGSHLGPVARAVLHDAECPVLLAVPGPAKG